MSTYVLRPGYLFASRDPLQVMTVLGSCVSVCLFDHCAKRGGMTHYLYPVAQARSEWTTRYGNVAIDVLVKILEKWGSSPRDMVASILGGASMKHSLLSEMVARQNVEIARKALKDRWGIPLVYAETGGHRGRKILFNTVSGDLEWNFLGLGADVE